MIKLYDDQLRLVEAARNTVEMLKQTKLYKIENGMVTVEQEADSIPWWRNFDRRIAVVGLIVAVLGLAISLGLFGQLMHNHAFQPTSLPAVRVVRVAAEGGRQASRIAQVEAQIMKMTALAELHGSMRSIGVDLQKFNIRLGHVEFDGLFSTRPNPYVLALTSRGRNPNFFKFDVERGYWIKEFFGDQYEVLLALLRIDGRAGQRLIPKNFLQQLNDCLPRQATVKAVPTESEIVILRPDLEQADRPYFDTWVYWDVNGKPSPTHENRTKTLEVLGAEALDYSDQMKASSKWSKTDCGRNWRDARKDDQQHVAGDI